MTQPILHARAAEVTYPGGAAALRPTDLRLHAGEFVVVLGPSGAGKSTLLRSLNGLTALTGGAIELPGHGALTAPADWRAHRKRTAMVFQQHQLIGRLSVLANVLTGRLAYHSAVRTLFPFAYADKLIALHALSRVGLAQHALKRADQLSGGEQQRVGIARALAQEPRLVLADEPVASLDPATALRVLTLIHDVCKADGIAAVVSLHQVDLARRFADRIVGISAGTVVFDGPPEALAPGVLERIYGHTSHYRPRASQPAAAAGVAATQLAGALPV